jgi:hypothetical protein
MASGSVARPDGSLVFAQNLSRAVVAGRSFRAGHLARQRAADSVV